MGMDQDLDVRFGAKKPRLDWEALQIEIARPEISGNGGGVGISEEGLEGLQPSG